MACLRACRQYWPLQSGKNARRRPRLGLAVERGKGFGHFHHTAYYIACAYALMNKPEQAIKWLESGG